MSELNAGDKVRIVNMPNKDSRELLGQEPSENVGVVCEIVEESIPLSDNTQTLAVIDCENGEEKKVNVTNLGKEIDAESGGVTIQKIEDEEEDDEEPEVVTDGGDDTAAFEDGEIVEAIQQLDDPDHPEATTVAEARDILGAVQRSFEDIWDLHMDAVEEGSMTVVYEDADVVVFADHTGHAWTEEFIQVAQEGADLDDPTKHVITRVHHTAARRLCDYNWSQDDPFVIRKPESFDAGQRYVEAVMNSLIARDVSPGQAWAYYGVIIRGNSRNQWAVRCGYSDHSAVSEPLRKAQEKLPR